MRSKLLPSLYFRMSKKEEKQNNILSGAFKLFLTKEYANVITADLEEITGVTRGAIYYKVKNKEGLYRAVIDKFVFDFLSASIKRNISVSEETPFKDFIMNELEIIENRIKLIKDYELDMRVSTRYLNLLFSAVFHYDGFKDKCNDLERESSELWLNYYRKGIEVGELNRDTDPELAVAMFRSLYYGDSFILSIVDEGLNVEVLRKKYLLLYNAIRS